MLTDKNLLIEGGHLDGTQRIYRFAGGHGLSLVNSPILNAYPFAWEAAVLKNIDDHDLGELDFSTELTEEVEVFDTDEEANDFINRAAQLFGDYVQEVKDED